MLALAAAVVFAIAFLINLTGASVPAAIGTTSLLLLGLTLLALHQAGFGGARADTRRNYRAFGRRR
jgi:hypothetical protein